MIGKGNQQQEMGGGVSKEKKKEREKETLVALLGEKQREVVWLRGENNQAQKYWVDDDELKNEKSRWKWKGSWHC